MALHQKRGIDKLLRGQRFDGTSPAGEIVHRYAECISMIENSTVVVSDLKAGTRNKQDIPWELLRHTRTEKG